MSAKTQARRMEEPKQEQAVLEVRKVLVQLIVTQIDPSTGQVIHEGAMEPEQIFEAGFTVTVRDYVNSYMNKKGLKARNLVAIPKKEMENG